MRTDPQMKTTQRGSTLLVAVVILLLASLMALMAMNVGVFEQRSSGNDLRAKIVKETAEAGLAQGFEFLMRANPEMLDNESLWETCAGLAEFPCTAVPDSQKSNMWRLKTTGYVVAGLDPVLTRHMLQLPAALEGAGVNDVAYGVAPVLCRVAQPISGTSISCTKDLSNASERRVVTFVSVAAMKSGDSGRTTLTQTVARSSILAPHAGQPTIIASGSATPPGNGTLIPMKAQIFEDGSSHSNDLGVWTLGNAKMDVGSFQVCSFGTFVPNEAEAGWVSNRDCSGGNCVCNPPMAPGLYEQDIVYDVEDSCAETAFGPDEIHCTKPSEFPCDLFEYAFSVKAWADEDNNGFCEKRIPASSVQLTGVAGNHTLYPDEVFLYTNAKQIIADDDSAAPIRADQKGPALTKDSKGLIWCHIDCLPNNNGAQVGSVENPVLVVINSDAATIIDVKAKIIGMLFFRQVGGELVPGAEKGDAGVGAVVKFNGTAEVFGSVIIQGAIDTGSGGATLVGDSGVLLNLRNSEDLMQYDTLRGGWSDRLSY